MVIWVNHGEKDGVTPLTIKSRDEVREEIGWTPPPPRAYYSINKQIIKGNFCYDVTWQTGQQCSVGSGVKKWVFIMPG